MATAGKNLSEIGTDVPSAKGMKLGLVVSEWNKEITYNLYKGAYDTLLSLGAKPENIRVDWVPGSYELPLASQWQLEYAEMDGVISIGSVIQGETRHFDFVCEAVSQGIKDVSLKYSKPVIFCVLTDNTFQQGVDRAGGKHGNKGTESAVALVKMIALEKALVG
ncbi:MAG: 6,7-dimethyl-8-ribityllumazine synthase [Flavobacteriales bacterium]